MKGEGHGGGRGRVVYDTPEVSIGTIVKGRTEIHVLGQRGKGRSHSLLSGNRSSTVGTATRIRMVYLIRLSYILALSHSSIRLEVFCSVGSCDFVKLICNKHDIYFYKGFGSQIEYWSLPVVGIFILFCTNVRLG